ncbi:MULTISPECIES: MarR family winged helix-turn-helix transcriptional regulator [unclassified Ornithinimicrobium]|uniref:MarR family winged helix-turn-helix transcriptional regulator n=1 Tax=unclassified Ornithinimicrobium TaxID=2615080 RepID=UPI0038542630
MPAAPQEAGALTPASRSALYRQVADAEAELHAIAMRWVDPVATSGDLTLRQLQVLAFLRVMPDTTGQQLAEAMSVSNPTMSGIVDRIASKGWVVRKHDPADRRRVLLRLTPEAQTLLTDLETPVQQVKSLIFDRLDNNDMCELARLVTRMRDAAYEVEAERGAARREET